MKHRTIAQVRTGLFSISCFLLTQVSWAQLKVNTNGYVGIGLTTPTMNLDVLGDGIFSERHSKAFFRDRDFYIGIPGIIHPASNGTPCKDPSVINKTNFWMRLGSEGGIAFFQHDGDLQTNGRWSMFVGRDGAVVSQAAGGQQSNLPHTFAVYGSAKAYGGYWEPSDARLKENIRPIDSALEKIAALKGVSFDYRQGEFPQYAFPKPSSLGFIAQDLESVLPEAVVVDANGTYAVKYDAIIPLLVEAVKSQQAQIAQVMKNLEDCQHGIL